MLKQLMLTLALSALYTGIAQADTDHSRDSVEQTSSDVTFEDLNRMTPEQIGKIPPETWKKLQKQAATGPKGSFMVVNGESLAVDEEGVVHEIDIPDSAAIEYERKQQRSSASSLESFATTYYYHGIPYEDAIKYQGQDYTVLLKILKNPQRVDYWKNVVQVLGMMGDEEVVDPLLAFIEANINSEDPTIHRAARTAIYALGFPIAHYNSPKALEWIEFTLNDIKLDRRYTKDGVRTAESATVADAMQSGALRALAVAGTEEAIIILREFKSKHMTSAAQSKATHDAQDKRVTPSLIDWYIESAENTKTFGRGVKDEDRH